MTVKKFQLLLCCLGAAAVAGCKTTPADVQASADTAIAGALTPANIQTVCGWIQMADVGFGMVAPFAGARITPAMIADEKKADDSATVLCTQPYPTDLVSLQSKLFAVLKSIQLATPAAS